MKKYCISDCEHNIVHHLARVLDDLWRYDQYVKDANKCGHREFAAMWKKIAEMDKKQSVMLRNALSQVVKEGRMK